MRKYNFIRPLMLIVSALLVKSLVTNLCMVMGMEPAPAENIGFIAMIITAIIIYSRIIRNRRK
ncbi:hypothetical protein L1N85_13670 [Paenibacillus alkaliterrae]|uniref:hypothetical protein n=1 Tax=Paenibacillus alkaliterrae TaxID=320909 RepID=UPI001F462E37|nr:hypothetical protein [Paenibacillus alkaliterrae]MCF2939468.1 hypothetical protein [Paenibacillus alkaliterrae]